jgi:hypothetical protein
MGLIYLYIKGKTQHNRQSKKVQQNYVRIENTTDCSAELSLPVRIENTTDWLRAKLIVLWHDGRWYTITTVFLFIPILFKRIHRS